MSDRHLDRRTVIKAGGLALVGLGLPGCSARTPPPAAPSRPMVELVPVNASWGRVLRTTVGLRPHRPGGFVVRAEKLDARTVVHDYGHGGAGHSLGWGTGALAADLAVAHDGRHAAVLGCGTVGLTAARQLQRRGFDVTIYTEAMPPHTTSNKAWAGYTPSSGLIAVGRRNPAWDAQFREAAEIGYRELQRMAGTNRGVSWVDSYGMLNDLREPREGRGESTRPRDPLMPAHLLTPPEMLGPGEHPFPSTYAARAPMLRIEPSRYLDGLTRDVIAFGGRITLRKFETLRDLMTLDESLIVNCTALGSRELFGDTELVPLKGQLTHLAPQADVNYSTMGGLPGSQNGLGIHMMPRSDGIALGGTSERGIWDTTPDEDARQRIVTGHIELFNAMARPRTGSAAAV
ncbi:MAG: FAD-dependent oxidoreductase [Vicinamibacterales bacterium]|nr:FAD-dependent oxidoreductase [Vicinamibacterales bacterium]MDP6610431.1 FAD-dependent oxidoreductase [Vicinamibacterales bacterium]